MTMEMPIARPATDAATATLPLASNQMSVDAVTPTGDASGLPMFDPVNLAEVDPGDAGPSTPTRVMYTSSGDTPGVDDIRAGTVTPRHARMVMGEGDDRVSLTIRMGDDGIRVHAQTATADAATALENASAELGQSMRDRGLDFAGFSATASEDGGTDQPDSDQVVQDEADGAGTEPDDESDGDDPFRRGVRAIA